MRQYGPLICRKLTDSKKVLALVSLRGLRRLTWVDIFLQMHLHPFDNSKFICRSTCFTCKGILFLLSLCARACVCVCVCVCVYVCFRPDGSVVSVSDIYPGGCEFETRLRQNFFPAFFRLSALLKHVRKVVGGFGKKFVLVLV